MKDETTRERGKRGEDAAAAYLTAHGCTVVARNVRLGHGEIDLIAEDGTRLLFVEVKTRMEPVGGVYRFGRPAAAVTLEKQRRIISAAGEYLRLHPSALMPRLDVCEVLLSRKDGSVLSLSYLPGAFRKR